MATQGSFNTNNVGNFYFTVEWNRTGYSSANNEHYIAYTVTAHNTQGYYRTVYLKSLTINGISKFYNTTGTSYYDGNVVVSDTMTISSYNDAGDGSLSISFEAGVGISSGSNCSGNDSWSLDRIPRQANITSAPDFNDEENPTITYSNPAGNSVDYLQACISLTGSFDDVPYRDIPKTGSSYTFSLTETERNILRNATTSNSRTVLFYVKTTISGTTFYSTLTKTFSIVNGNPVFSTCTYEDTGGISTNLTGDNQIIIKGFNDVDVIISTANKASAKKGASMVKYRAVCGNLISEENYSSNSDVILNLPYIQERTITIYALDSRGNSTAVPIYIENSNWKDYFDPVIRTGSIARQNGVNTQTTLTFTGNIWKTDDEYDFGAVDNSIIQCYYQYKKTTDSSYGTAINITPTLNSNGSFSFSSLINGDLGSTGFTLSDSFNVRIYVQDATAKSYTYDLLLGVGSPGIAIHKNGVSFGTPYNTSEGGVFQVKGVDPFKYSTTEKKIGTWINGKPLYRKVITTTNTITNDSTIPHNISNVDIIYIKTAFFYNESYGKISWQLPIDLYGTSNTITDRVGAAVGTDNIIFKCDTSWSTTWTKYIVLEYTKTTD